MMQLIIVVLAIALGALFVAGGVSYLSTDVGSRVETSQALRIQMDAVTAAVSSYRFANNGFVPAGPIEAGTRIGAHLPDGRIPERFRNRLPFTWSVVRAGHQGPVMLCLKKNENEAASSNVSAAVHAFALEHGRRFDRNPSDRGVRHALKCDDDFAFASQEIAADTAYLRGKDEFVLLIRDF